MTFKKTLTTFPKALKYTFKMHFVIMSNYLIYFKVHLKLSCLITVCRALKKYTYFDVVTNILKHMLSTIIVI